MKVTTERMIPWLERLLGLAPRDNDLQTYLNDIPRLESLADLPPGTPVLIRGDVDAKPGASVGEGDVRLRSMVDTLKYGQERGWKQIVFGHIGRKPEGSLDKVAKRLGELLGGEVTLLKEWLSSSQENLVVSDATRAAIDSAPNGSVLLLENTRAYPIETVLWKAKTEADVQKLAPQLAFATTLSERIAKVYINEALSAGSLDTSSTVAPIAMDRVALGRYLANELEGPMMQCIEAQFVVFSGIKIDKLDDLEAMINRGKITHILSAGSLAMALTKAAAQLDGGDFSLGNSEDPAHADKPYYIPPERIAQAKRMVQEGRRFEGIEFILPVDFLLADGSAVDTIGAGQQQFDIGPKSIAHFEQKVGEFIESSRGKSPIAFHNGVFGMFEDPRFEGGTKAFISQLKRMKDAGVQVYVGGGEGGTALEKYGSSDWVTHTFTAGGTVLNALGSEPIPYLVALRMAARP